MSIKCVGMLLGLPHLQMVGWRDINILPLNYSRWTKRWLFLSSGAPDSSVHIGHVRCLGHVSRPLRATTVDRWKIRCQPLARLFGAHQTVRCYSTRESSLWSSLYRLSDAHRTCPVLHQSADWLSTSWISSLFSWTYFGLESCTYDSWISPMDLGVVGAPFGKPWFPSVRRCTGLSGAHRTLHNATTENRVID
jgi:hypothetical protein